MSERERYLSRADLVALTNNFADECGSGSFGIVYRGRDPATQRQVAAKVMRTDTHGAGALFDTFYNELELLLQVKHQNVVSLVAVCRELPALVFEFADNGTLAEHLADFSPLDLALDAMRDIACGLDYLHTFTPSIIHRDVTAGNILLDRMMRCSLGDLGVSRMFPKIDEHMTHITTQIVGTPGYLDPFYMNTGRLTTKTDMFSYGVIMLQIMTQKQAIHGGQPLRDYLTDAIEDGIPTSSLIAFVDDISDVLFQKLWNIALQCSSHRPHRRPSATEVFDDLGVIIHGKRSDCVLRMGRLMRGVPCEVDHARGYHVLQDPCDVEPPNIPSQENMGLEEHKGANDNRQPQVRTKYGSTKSYKQVDSGAMIVQEATKRNERHKVHYKPGMVLVSILSVVMQGKEKFKSGRATNLKIGAVVKVKGTGSTGKFLFVEDSSCKEGWVSRLTKRGKQIWVEPKNPEAAFEVAVRQSNSSRKSGLVSRLMKRGPHTCAEPESPTSSVEAARHQFHETCDMNSSSDGGRRSYGGFEYAAYSSSDDNRYPDYMRCKPGFSEGGLYQGFDDWGDYCDAHGISMNS